MTSLLSDIPRQVLQPFFLEDEAKWSGTDVILAEQVIQTVMMHTIPNFSLPNKVGLYFLNTVASFPSPIYADLILNDPYIKNIHGRDCRINK